MEPCGTRLSLFKVFQGNLSQLPPQNQALLSTAEGDETEWASIIIPRRQLKPKLLPTQQRVVPKPLQAGDTDGDNFPIWAAPATVTPRGVFLPFNYFPRAYSESKITYDLRDRRAPSCRDKPAPSPPPGVVPCVGSGRRAHLCRGNAVSCPLIPPTALGGDGCGGKHGSKHPSPGSRVYLQAQVGSSFSLQQGRGKKKN